MPNCGPRDAGLSEVVGFVLILGVLVLVASLYLTYGIPAQGRENEILHMNEVKDQFVGYKVGVDSLWVNDRRESAISNTFSLGTGGSYTQGGNSIIPIMQPVPSSGTMAINQRTEKPENISITAYSNIISTTNAKTRAFVVPLSPAYITESLNGTPRHLFVNITPNDITVPSGVLVSCANWSANVSVVPRNTYYNYSTITCTAFSCNPEYHDATQWTGTDIAISIARGNTNVTDGYVIYSKITPGSEYSVDLMNDAYGIAPVIGYPDEPRFTSYSSKSSSTAMIVYRFSENAYYTYQVPMGALEYNAQNYYWIPQHYYYQLGGVFLSQDGGTTYKLPPEISFAYKGNGIIDVTVDAIAYTNTSTGIVGGNSPVQVITVLNRNSGDLPLATAENSGLFTPNTQNVSISVITSDDSAKAMWKNYFDEAANRTGGVPREYYEFGDTPTGSYIFVKGIREPEGLPDINLQVKAVNVTANIRGLYSRVE